MIWNPFKIVSKAFLGVDIGTFSIKIVEMSRAGRKRKLENYGEIQAQFLYQKPFRTFEKNTLTVANSDVIRAIKAILGEAKIKTTQAYFSIPDFSSFFTTFTLPVMTEEELPQAVNFEARQHIPLPLQEVTLDWQVINERERVREKSIPIKILMVAVPNEIIEQYQRIAEGAKLELLSLEAEVFGLARALIGEKEKEETICLVDIGARSTTISIIDGGNLKLSHSFDTSGNDLTNIIAKGLRLDYNEAEKLKKEHGLLSSKDKIRETLLPLVDLISNEIEKILPNFYHTEQKEIQRIILAGGTALLPGIVEHLQKNLQKPIEIAQPFSNIYYPPILEDTLKVMGPSYAIAVGTSLHGLEKT